jgi:hypothetical protein
LYVQAGAEEISFVLRYEYFGGIKLFQKKDIIYSETIGVCIVDDIVKLADNKKDIYQYYLLRSAFDRKKKAYIPVENHTVQLRNLISLREAVALQEAKDYEKKSALVKEEVLYVIENSKRGEKLSENSENTIQNN